MRKIVFVAVVILFVCGLAAPVFSQETDYNVEGWKKRVASPTYGLALAFLPLTDEDGNELDTLVIPGFEMRIFNGTNVAKRGGFFVGYEVGTIFFVFGESGEYPAIGGAGPTIVQLNEFFVGTLFLLSKYGYRLDLGIEAAGLSLGVEAGMGLQVSMGGVDVRNVISDEEQWLEVYAPFSLVLDAAAEAAFRLGQNFRVFGRLGVMVMPQLVEISWGSTGFDDFNGMVSPAILNMRLGFALNY